ncbi:hypothetical protein Q4512_02635 [Oceanihabitans sp. 2_MG-2023]|uniref:hypothetical protein n=1 Tax=Oceanihabitans sp. 2_MG-2023 TaxID=3062661 RepID=UPI0026E443E6|nr:hypothetical protein [Oceanihabitans sp. 2_MG-2023]MDO6595794.1 hypothetical protein [Oceanihabitans sp. 2_MG-2023]
MFNFRYLKDNEITFISNRINRTKKALLGLFILVFIIITIVAFFVYSELDATNYAINVIFGVLILLLYFLNWFVKGYKEHVIDRKVQKSEGFYKRIYEQHGKNGRYYDTINGIKIKIPWHWRSYLKAQKEKVTFEFIVRDGAVAFNEGASLYLISVNDTLSLDYELKNGLKKTKPISFINMASIVLIIPISVILYMNRDINTIQNFLQLTKTEKDILTLNASEDILQIQAPNYITIKNAWVYQYKRPYDLYGENYVITKAERDRIYYNPSSHANYQYYLPAKAFTKPEKESFKKQLKENMEQFGFQQKMDSSLWEKSISIAFKSQMSDYKKRIFRAKRMDSVFNELKPKTSLLKLYDNCFNPSEKKTYSIKSSLEKTYVIRGFYYPKKNTIISFEEQENKRKEIKNACLLFCFCAIIAALFIVSIFKIASNSILKKRLVEAQLNINTGDPRIQK